MNENAKQLQELQEWSELDCDTVDFDDLENQLEVQLQEQLAELDILEQDREKIGNPDTIGETVMNVVWDQIINQIGDYAGKEFIKENRDLTLDLRNSAHIQTTENFAEGNIANHNTKINYQERYDGWQGNFQHDEKGNVITHPTRAGKEEATLVKGARKSFDNGRPVGSAERGTDMDHTVSAGEIIRDPAANAHLTKEEQTAFANSDVNLNEMDASLNRSKGDNPMTVWLDNPNAKGQKPNEIYDISEEQDKQYRDKDAEAREKYEEVKKEGEQRSIETGKQSQKEEAMLIGKKALRSVLIGLLANLIKNIIRKLIEWFRSSERKLSTFIESVKEAIKSFVSNIKQHLHTAVDTSVTTIATAFFGPVIGTIKKAWIFLKQGYKSVKEAIQFLKDPANKNKPFSIKMMEVGKIVVVGLTAGGAIALGGLIENGLSTIPGFAIDILSLGSLANIIGIFLGALVSGLIGALALNMIDRLISKRLGRENTKQQIEKKGEIIQTLDGLIDVTKIKVAETKRQVARTIAQRHIEAGERFNDIKNTIEQNSIESDELHDLTVSTNEGIADLLNNI